MLYCFQHTLCLDAVDVSNYIPLALDFYRVRIEFIVWLWREFNGFANSALPDRFEVVTTTRYFEQQVGFC